MQAVLAARAEEEAEIELGGRVDHRELRREGGEILGRQRLGPRVLGQPELGERGAGRRQRARPAVLERAGERLAAVGEGGADQVAGLRVGGRPGAPQAEDRRLDPRPRPEDRRVDGAHQPHLAGELGEDAGAAVGAAAGRGPQPVGDLTLDHHRPGGRPSGSCLDRAQDDRRRDRVGKVGDDPGRRRLQRPEVELHRVRPVQVDVRPRRDRRQRPLEAAVDLDRVDPARRLRQPLGQHPFAGPDLEHHVAGLEPGVADDRVEQVGVGEEVLPEPHHWKRARALASTVRSSCS